MADRITLPPLAVPIVQVSVRLPLRLYEALRREAQERDQSMNSVFCEALEAYVPVED